MIEYFSNEYVISTILVLLFVGWFIGKLDNP